MEWRQAISGSQKMLVEVHRLTVCPCLNQILPPHGSWTQLPMESVPMKFRSLGAVLFGTRVSSRHGEDKAIALSLEQELIQADDITRVTKWELYHRDGADASVGGMNMYRLWFEDGSHIKACLTPEVYDILRGA